MKRLLIPILALLVLAPAALPAEETEKKPADSSLVDAAKKTKETRKKKTGKVITNADVKKSRGKLLVVDKPAPPATAPKSTVGPFAQQDIDRKARLQAEEKVAVHEKKVGELQKELTRIEQSYYDENDPNYRDDIIQKRFDQTRRQLDSARQNLADARDALGRVTTPKP